MSCSSAKLRSGDTVSINEGTVFDGASWTETSGVREGEIRSASQRKPAATQVIMSQWRIDEDGRTVWLPTWVCFDMTQKSSLSDAVALLEKNDDEFEEKLRMSKERLESYFVIALAPLAGVNVHDDGRHIGQGYL